MTMMLILEGARVRLHFPEAFYYSFYDILIGSWLVSHFRFIEHRFDGPIPVDFNDHWYDFILKDGRLVREPLAPHRAEAIIAEQQAAMKRVKDHRAIIRELALRGLPTNAVDLLMFRKLQALTEQKTLSIAEKQMLEARAASKGLTIELYKVELKAKALELDSFALRAAAEVM